MKVEIITPDAVLFSGENIHLVQLPGATGSFEIMTDHAPLISTLKQGKVKVMRKGETPEFFEIKGGVIEVLNNHVLVLAE
jgi:F-type H+-transporting ATPase subunit epsilon